MSQFFFSSFFRLLGFVLPIVLIVSGLNILNPTVVYAEEETPAQTNPDFLGFYVGSFTSNSVTVIADSNISPNSSLPVKLYRVNEPSAVQTATEATESSPEYNYAETRFTIPRPSQSEYEDYYVTFGDKTSDPIRISKLASTDIQLNITAINPIFSVGTTPILKWNTAIPPAFGIQAVYLVNEETGSIVYKSSTAAATGQFSVTNFTTGPARTYRAYFADDVPGLTNFSQLTNTLATSSTVELKELPGTLLLKPVKISSVLMIHSLPSPGRLIKRLSLTIGPILFIQPI